MTHPIYLVSPLNTSPNSVSDLGEKSVNPMKREWYIQIHILIHIAHIVHLNESEWSSIRSDEYSVGNFFILIQKYPSMHTIIYPVSESCQHPNPDINPESCPSYQVPLKLWSQFPARWQRVCFILKRASSSCLCQLNPEDSHCVFTIRDKKKYTQRSVGKTIVVIAKHVYFDNWTLNPTLSNIRY